ncbi:MAG: YkgJ family cysteine cluster protein [Thermoplasmata archaeon]
MEVSYAFMGSRYTCYDKCAYCCLCEPEIPDTELPKFLSQPELKENVIRKFSDGEYKYVIKLKNKHGACIFLKQRKCGIYLHRPLYCRLYPLQRHLSTRLQYTANLSCRGLWANSGEEITELANRNGIDEHQYRNAIKVINERYRNAKAEMEEYDIYISQQELQQKVSEILPLLTTKEGLGKVVSFADANEFGSVETAEIIGAEISMNPDKYATEMSLDVFAEKELLNLPVYPGKNFEWYVLRYDKPALNWYLMDEEGNLTFHKSVEDFTHLKNLTHEAKNLLEAYIELLNKRDITYGNAILLTEFYRYEVPLISNYLGALATSVLEVWWRANLFAENIIGREAMQEGIIFYDADYLDKPTYGAVL